MRTEAKDMNDLPNYLCHVKHTSHASTGATPFWMDGNWRLQGVGQADSRITEREGLDSATARRSCRIDPRKHKRNREWTIRSDVYDAQANRQSTHLDNGRDVSRVL